MPQNRPRTAPKQNLKFSEQSRPVQVITFILTLVAIGLLICCCVNINNFINGLSTDSTATPTPANLAASSSPKPTKTPTATPKPKPTATPTRKPTCRYPAVDDNPYCYTFTNTGKLITDPPADFCVYFNCISSFDNGSGYVVECANGQYSKSGGRTGVCSKQGGFKRNLYAP